MKLPGSERKESVSPSFIPPAPVVSSSSCPNTNQGVKRAHASCRSAGPGLLAEKRLRDALVAELPELIDVGHVFQEPAATRPLHRHHRRLLGDALAGEVRRPGLP